jgi:cobalt/nickel transport system permease protein
MIQEPFAEGESLFHRMDPRVKILGATGFSIVLAVATRPSVLLSGILFACLLVVLARLKVRQVFYRLLVVNTFVAFLWIFLPFTFPGEPVFSIGALNVSREGILKCLEITIKSNAIVLVSMALLSTSTVFGLVHGLHHLKVPHKLVHLFFFSFRYIHVINTEYHKIINAMKTRGFEPGTGLHTYRTYAYLLGTLFLKSSERSKRVYEAMICRGFDGTFWVYQHFSFRKRDLIALILMGFYVLLLAFMEWGVRW